MAGNARHTHVHPAGLTRHDDRRRQGHTSERTPHLDVPAERHEPYRQGAQPSSTLVLGSRRAATQLWHSPRLITDAGSGPAAGWRARPPAQHSGSVYGWRPPPLGRRLGRIELSSLLALRWRRLCVLPAARRRRRTAAPWRRGRPLSGCGRSRRGPARVMAGSRLAATPWSRVLAPRPPARVPRLLRILVPGGGRIQARPGPRPLGSGARARGGRLGVCDGWWAGRRAESRRCGRGAVGLRVARVRRVDAASGGLCLEQGPEALHHGRLEVGSARGSLDTVHGLSGDGCGVV